MNNIKLRKCIVCNEYKDKSELFRVVKNKLGEINIDETGKLNGRGAYICNNSQCIHKAVKSKALNRALKCNIPNEIYQELEAM